MFRFIQELYIAQCANGVVSIFGRPPRRWSSNHSLKALKGPLPDLSDEFFAWDLVQKSVGLFACHVKVIMSFITKTRSWRLTSPRMDYWHSLLQMIRPARALDNGEGFPGLDEVGGPISAMVRQGKRQWAHQSHNDIHPNNPKHILHSHKLKHSKDTERKLPSNQSTRRHKRLMLTRAKHTPLVCIESDYPNSSCQEECMLRACKCRLEWKSLRQSFQWEHEGMLEATPSTKRRTCTCYRHSKALSRACTWAWKFPMI